MMKVLVNKMSNGGEQRPADPIAAVTHPDPYPYYAELVAIEPIYRDEKLASWIAASAAAVTSVLGNPLCRVRPLAEPVPNALLGSAAGDIFSRLIRMNERERHTPLNQAVGATLRSIELPGLTEHATKYARLLADELRPNEITRLSQFNFSLSAYVVASLLGVPVDQLAQTTAWVSEFVRCVAPTSTPDQIEQGKAAAAHLFAMFRALLATSSNRPQSWLARLALEAKNVDRGDRDLIVANAIGFLSQAYEATAGLIGNTLLTLARHAWLRERLSRNPALLSDIIDEVLRYDPPTHNTRRFVTEEGTIAGQKMKSGDAILVVLAAANHDPAVNPEPEKLDPDRRDRKIFTFGSATHACPGAAIAATIARAGIEGWH